MFKYPTYRGMQKMFTDVVRMRNSEPVNLALCALSNPRDKHQVDTGCTNHSNIYLRLKLEVT